MSRLDALKLTTELKRRLVDFAVSSNALRDGEAMEACRGIWEAEGSEGGLASDLWVEGSIPHKSSDKTLKDAVSANLFSKKMADHLYLRKVFNDNMKLHFHQWSSMEKAARHTNPAIIISAGTGAGKTESFLLPLLTDLMDRPRTPNGGCRAIILYPMNALVNDQVDRLYDWLKQQRDLTLCHFTSETPEDKSKIKGLPKFDACRFRTRAHARGLEDADGWPLGKNGAPRGTVPDILITNYSMLEYMLCRPQDSVFFGPDLRSVVLDEAHLYTSTLAAEMTLLLRRLYDKCDLRPEDVCQYATSATIATGSSQEQQAQLKEFASTLFSKPVDMVHPILGRQATSSLPEAAPPAGTPRPQDLVALNVDVTTIEMSASEEQMVTNAEDCARLMPILKALVDEKKVEEERSLCNDMPGHLLLALRFSPLVHNLETVLRGKKQVRLNDLASQLWGEATQQAQEATVLLLNLCASARDSLNSAPLIPHRLHQMLRPPEGFSVCCNPDCSVSDMPGLGKLYPGRQERCGHCESLCLALYRCSNCGDHLLAGVKPKSGRLQLPSREPNVFYSLTDGTPQILNFIKGVEAGHGAPGMSCFVCGEECPRCQAPRKAFKALRTANSLVLSILAETMLAQLPSLATKHEGSNAYLPAGGRRLLAFSDSRSEAAALGPRLRHQHEIQLVRAAIVKLFASSAGADPEVIASYKDDIAELEAKLKAGKFPTARIAEKQAERDTLKAQLNAVQKGGSVQRWADDLVKRPEMAQLLDEESGDFHQADSWCQKIWESNAMNIRKRGIRLLGRELFRVPRRALVTVETIGCVEVVFPGLDELKAPSSLLGEMPDQSISDQLSDVWPELLAALADSIRYDGAATFGSEEEDRLWFSEGRVPGHWSTRRSFIGVKEKHRRRVFVGKILEAVGLEDAEDYVERVLETVFDQLKARAVRSDIGVREAVGENQFPWLETSLRQSDHGNEDALRIVFPELALRKPAALYISQTTGHVWPRSVLGCAPEVGQHGTLRPITEAELDAAPHLGRTRRELRSESPIFQFGLWAEEHSAQLSPAEARRRQELFRIGARNLLSATTTLELGIDIGGLSGTFLSNVPPGLANYLQRAGRVGRRADGSSIVVTCAQSRPFDREVFRNVGRFLERKLRRPLVLMERHRIVARHFHAWLMNQFFSQIYGRDHFVGAMQAFGQMGIFCGQPMARKWDGQRPDLQPAGVSTGQVEVDWWRDHDTGGLVPHFLDWLNHVDANLATFRPRLDKLFQNTPLTKDGYTWEKALQEARTVFGRGLDRWQKDYTSLLGTWREATKPEQANAISYQLRVLYRMTVIESMANARFLPRYGFPIGVHNLKVVTTDDRGRTREEDQFRLSRPSLLALREYVPGSQLLVGGKLVTSHGILKHWTGANLDEAMGLRGGAGKCPNEHAFYWIGEQTPCPDCGGKAQTTRNLLFPSHGFTTAAWDPPRRSADIERVGSVLTGTTAFANRGTAAVIKQDLAGVPGLEAVYQEEVDMIVYNHGEHDRGFAICTKCGYADSEPKEPKTALPAGFARHKPLLAHKGGPCWSGDKQNALIRNQSLAAREPTDMLLLDFSSFLGADALKAELVTSLAIAFRLSGARLLELDSRELGEMVVRAGNAWGAVIYDNVPGGAGHVLELMNRGREWLEDVRSLLYVDEAHHQRCRTACLDCVLTFDAQSYFNDPDTALDRRKALEWVDRMLEASTQDRQPAVALFKPAAEDFSVEEELIDEEFLHLLDLSRHGILPRPVVGYSLLRDSRIVAEAELAWEEKEIALVLDEEDRRVFMEAGWTAYLPEEFEQQFSGSLAG